MFKLPIEHNLHNIYHPEVRLVDAAVRVKTSSDFLLTVNYLAYNNASVATSVAGVMEILGKIKS